MRVDFARLVNDSGLNDHDLCDMFDVSIPTVHRWRSGESEPQPRMRQRVVATLIGRDGNKEPGLPEAGRH